MLEVGDQCAICQETMTAPVILSCKHIFCEECVGAWYALKDLNIKHIYIANANQYVGLKKKRLVLFAELVSIQKEFLNYPD